MHNIRLLTVSITDQVMSAFNMNGDLLSEFNVSTAKNGTGELNGSECTPLGSHRIRAKIGAKKKINTVFVGRRDTGEVYSEQLDAQNPSRDWILTRIMWLCGNELGRNRGENVDTMRRYIYIHGAPDSHQMGTPSSHGCVKMHNDDIIQLFDRVDIGCEVIISN